MQLVIKFWFGDWDELIGQIGCKLTLHLSLGAYSEPTDLSITDAVQTLRSGKSETKAYFDASSLIERALPLSSWRCRVKPVP